MMVESNSPSYSPRLLQLFSSSVGYRRRIRSLPSRRPRGRGPVGRLGVLAGQLPLVADYALSLAASAYQGLGLKPQAIDLLSRLLLEHPRRLLTERAER